MSGGFKRSSVFGIVGVFVVAGVCGVIGLTMGSGEANPKPALRLDSTETASRSEVTLAVPSNEFEVGSRKVKVESGPEGITVTRKGGEQSDWLSDLWLAERLADA